ncbi:MAG TPA: carboxypeptidase regulatory-like domain-containing protein [Blastocatellia bacterium]|nr:carboxypeptidase regulatory-like domain-containing protein [Blastocatellia bacterium]
MGRSRFIRWLVICLFFCCASSAKAQQDTGTISGTVSDKTGAVVAGAQVTITNENTGLKRTVSSNDSGFYTATLLPVGVYTISVTATGFKTTEHRGIDLHVREEKIVPVVLEVGEVTATVQVTGGAQQVELSSGEVASLIGSQQVKELPLNGRSFVQLTLLVPGASVSDSTRTGNTGLLAGVDISMSGSPANANGWLVDGVDNVDHGSGRTILVYPSIDSIEEFKVQTNSYGADQSAAGGAQISLVTKSGTNQFHGSGYFFIRNDALNATNFFLNAAGAPKQELDYKNFGYTIGGPIKKEKLFFFWSQEWRRESRGVVRQSTVPTLLERQGDFSGPHSGDLPTPTDPFTGQPFPGNRIPANRLSPAGLAIMKLYPEPTNSNTINNWVAAPVTKIPTWQIQGRGDWNITSKHTLMFRYTQDSWKNPAPNFGAEGGLWGDTGFPTVDSDWDQPSKNIATRLTTTFGPTMVNQFQFSYANNRIFITPGLGAEINDEINSKIPEVFPGPDARAHATFWGAPLPGIGANLWNIAPWDNGQDLWIWKDDFSLTKGEHTFKMGGLFSTNKKDEICCSSADTPQFWGPTAVPGGAGVGGGWGDPNAPGNGGQVTGNGLADLLLKGTYWGGADEQSFVPTSLIRWRDYELYFNDTWRMRPGFTLTYGLRYSYLPQTYQDDNLMANFVLSLYDPKKGADPLNGLIFPKELKMPEKGIPGGEANLRGIDVGRALRKNHKHNFSPRIGIAWDPTGAGKWAIRAGAGMFYGRADLSNPVGALIQNPPFVARIDWGAGRPLDSIPGTPPGGTLGTPSAAADIESKQQGSYQWNLFIERELMKDTTFQIGYVGNRGHHLGINWNLNYVPSNLRLEFARRALNPDNPAGEEDQLRLLFPLKGNQSLIYQTFAGDSSYHALQMQLVKRFSNGLSYQVSYSWSKLLALAGLNCCGGGDNTRITDPENLRYDRGLADFDRTHILTMNAIYKLPGPNSGVRALNAILSGWEVTGIYQYASGVPLTVGGGPNIGIPNRVDLVGDPEGAHTAQEWIRRDAYRLPLELGRLGMSPRGSARAPGINNLDTAIYRNFRLPREGMSIQFRAEFFNILNHTQFLNIDTGFTTSGIEADLRTNRIVRCDTLPGHSFPDCNTNANFGKPTRARDPREIQFGIKFNF